MMFWSVTIGRACFKFTDSNIQESYIKGVLEFGITVSSSDGFNWLYFSFIFSFCELPTLKITTGSSPVTPV